MPLRLQANKQTNKQTNEQTQFKPMHVGLLPVLALSLAMVFTNKSKIRKHSNQKKMQYLAALLPSNSAPQHWAPNWA